MRYSSSSRPTFDWVTHIPYRSVTRHLGGDSEASSWLDRDRHDGGYDPEGVRHRYWNRSSSPVEIVPADAPGYLP
jgi:hypothetical protein